MSNFRVHCDDTLGDRLGNSDAANLFAEETQDCSQLRSLVLELCQPIFGSKRIVNMDNYYTSPQLLEQLYLKGLYARGVNKRHVPQYLVFSKKDLKSGKRGDIRYGVCKEGINRPMVFYS